ncbi:MAG: hypothetical protein OXU92_05265 [Deltaproteobacteria bacterium]|nr:hypothetical protein [Deltaproteobacteria bacterium]
MDELFQHVAEVKQRIVEGLKYLAVAVVYTGVFGAVIRYIWKYSSERVLLIAGLLCFCLSIPLFVIADGGIGVLLAVLTFVTSIFLIYKAIRTAIFRG